MRIFVLVCRHFTVSWDAQEVNEALQDVVGQARQQTASIFEKVRSIAEHTERATNGVARVDDCLAAFEKRISGHVGQSELQVAMDAKASREETM